MDLIVSNLPQIKSNLFDNTNRSKFLIVMEGGVPKFKKSKSRDPVYAHFGVIRHLSSVVHIVLATADLTKKNEVSSFFRSKVMESSQNIKSI